MTATAPSVTLRPLLKTDLEAVVALDKRAEGGSRRGYFERRLGVALRWPKRHLQLAALADGQVVGFLLARTAGGEFGRKEPAIVLEAINVDPAARHHGVGQQMLGGLSELARGREVTRLVTQVDWHSHPMMRFLDAAKFELAPRIVLARKVHRMPLPQTDEEIEAFPPLVRHLREDDLDMVCRIDRATTGEDRSEYLRRKVDEVLTESAIEVSLVSEEDGHVVAFVMARVDLGDFGHVGATASLDTIGVNPGHASKGHARAILTQMIDNLAALHVERLETEVAHDAFGLLRFLYRFGFGPSDRLPMQRKA
jgi:ribosomal protein S18 acetylase RimI-like enzyme